MLLADLVATSDAVAATRARSTKTAALAELIRRVPADEVVAAVAFLTGEPRHGKVGVGWATVFGLERPPPAPEPSLTIGELDDAIGRLGELGGTGSGAARTALLIDLLARATDREGDFIRRLLLGELRQGALEGVVVEAIAKAADVPASLVRRAAMLAGDAPVVAAIAMADGAPGLRRVSLLPLRPVKPMLASTAPSLAAALEGLDEASVEWKLDGARVQAHRAGDEVRLYTRNLNDVTDRLPEIVDVVRSLPCSSIVLDGEVLGVGVDDERPDPFQDTMSQFGRRTGTARGLIVRFFDCIHLDGRDLLDEPLRARLEALAVTGPHRITGIVTGDLGEAESFQGEALRTGHEGVMVKSLDSAYEAGRRGGSWRKVKPVITLDLVVLGVEWGSGRRKGWLSNLHLGARAADGSFVMVGKTFKGMTDDLLRWQTERLLQLERERHGHVVLVRPELVVEVAIDGVQASSRYPGGVTLRFARVRQYREDKAPHEADTIETLRGLLRGGPGDG